MKWNLDYAHVAQLVEHVLGKNGVTGSSPVVGSIGNGMRNEKWGNDQANNSCLVEPRAGRGHKMYTVGKSRVIMETSGRLARPLTRER